MALRRARPGHLAAFCAWLAAGAAGVLLALGAGAALAQDVQPVPPLGARVTDTTGTLQPAERDALEAKLAAFEAEAGPQIAMLMVATTAPEDIASYAQRVADAWKIGRRSVGDGVLVVVAKNDRRVRIEVAKALEGAIPDLAARQIIDRAVRPAFQAGRWAAGLDGAADQIIARIRGENLPPPEARGAAGAAGAQWQEIGLFLFVAVPVVGSVLGRVFGRKLGTLLTAGGAGALAWLFTASLLIAAFASLVTLVVVGVLGLGSALKGVTGGRRGGGVVGPWGGIGTGGIGHGGGWSGGGGGGFGGFRSGGGGDFGGGGASGSW